MEFLNKIKDLVTVTKKSVQKEGVDPKSQSELNRSGENQKASLQGVDCDNLLEPVPFHIAAPCERTWENANNSQIVLGRDRPSVRSSGYGGKGDTQAASIDIVVGRMGYKVRGVDKKGEPLGVDPSFEADAARIYISQKTDLDKDFDLAVGKVGTATAKSGIALKADGIRLVAREGIKLISSESKKNSQGGDLQGFLGIDLIAGNVDEEKDGSDLQPMVKGNNLAKALIRLTYHVEKLNGIVDSFLESQMEFNNQIMNHTHKSPFFIIDTTPSPTLVSSGARAALDLLGKAKDSLIKHKINLGSYKQTYLKQSGKKYINSRYNNVN